MIVDDLPPLATRHDTNSDDWRSHLERAVAGDGVTAHYQPIVDLQRRVVVGYEALARFSVDPTFTGPPPPANPDAWFAAAEVSGMADRLEAVTLSAALRRRADLPRNCFLSVNLEPSSLSSPEIRQIFASEGHLGGIVVEIAEHGRWTVAELEGTIDWLREAGALIAIDAADSGHAGLQTILELRPSIVKLDRQLVTGLESDDTKAALVEVMGVFADTLDARLLAEGVETQSEACRLASIGVPLGQGFYFARPAPSWAVVERHAFDPLENLSGRSGDNLFGLVAPIPTVDVGNEHAANALFHSHRWVPVVDLHRRPVGLVDQHGAMYGEVTTALVANVYSGPAEVASRLSSSARDHLTPVIVVDNSGRYLGVVTLRRLLGQLARAVRQSAQGADTPSTTLPML